MLKELKFVQGAVARKDFLPAMTHFRIESGHVRSFNGFMALSSPIPFDIDCTPKADVLIRAISNCNETITLSLTPAGKLRIQSGKFRAHVDLIDGPTPHVEPAGERVNFDGQVLLDAFKTIYGFIGDDASRPWTNGVLLKGQSAYATNNVCLVEYWLGVETPVVINIPAAAIKEMLRIDEPPTYAQMDRNSVTFHYTDGRWIRSQLLETNWPFELMTRVLDVRNHTATEIVPEMFEGLETIKGFTDDLGRVYIKDGVLRTHLEEELGANYTVDGLSINGLYQEKMLSLLKGVATHADFSRYPEPVLFFGERLRGAVIGMKM